ncbi:hypothetical protein ACYTFC_17195 [Streptomyces globosus]
MDEIGHPLSAEGLTHKGCRPASQRSMASPMFANQAISKITHSIDATRVRSAQMQMRMQADSESPAVILRHMSTKPQGGVSSI